MSMGETHLGVAGTSWPFPPRLRASWVAAISRTMF